MAQKTNEKMDIDDDKTPEKTEEDVHPVEKTVVDEIHAILTLLQEAVARKETQLVNGRLFRQTLIARKKMVEKDILDVIKTRMPEGHPVGPVLEVFLEGNDMEMDEKENNVSNSTAVPEVVRTIALPECEMYIYLLVIMRCLDTKQFQKAKQVSIMAVERLSSFNRRTLDHIGSRIYGYYSWSHECCGELESIRSKLLNLQRMSILRNDESGQETLLNLLLHNYLHSHLYDHAEKLRSKTQLLQGSRNMHQFCRYLYYVGRIRAIQLDYTESKDNLQQALRKAPQSAKGFRIILYKWLAMVSLLLGEIPERTHFTQPGMRSALKPYFKLTQAIRIGDLKAFQQVAQTYADQFLKDKTHNLIVRLQHNVIRTGLRRISKAYSRIALSNVAEMLGLESAVEAECIVAKAVRDGAIDAKIDHGNAWMTTTEASDTYSTFEPQQAFHSRAMFCLNLHNEAVKAMKYKPNQHKESAESAEARKERQQQEQELAKHLQEEDGDF